MEFKGSLTVPDITREALKILLLDAQLKLVSSCNSKY